MAKLNSPGDLAKNLAYIPQGQQPSDRCDLCDEEWGNAPILYWMLGQKWLWFHPKCAAGFGQKLIEDAKTNR